MHAVIVIFPGIQLRVSCTATCASHAPSEDGGAGPGCIPAAAALRNACMQAVLLKSTIAECGAWIMCSSKSPRTERCYQQIDTDGVRTFMDAYSIGGPAEKSVLVQKSVVLTARRQFAAVSVAGEVCAGVYDAGICAQVTQVLHLLALACTCINTRPCAAAQVIYPVSPCKLCALQGCQALESTMQQGTHTHPLIFPRCTYHMHAGTYQLAYVTVGNLGPCERWRLADYVFACQEAPRMFWVRLGRAHQTAGSL